MSAVDDQLEWMVRTQLESRGIRDPRVLGVFRRIDRGRFVPPNLRGLAYEDCPLAIGEGQTISQPYIVALMTQSLCLEGAERVLEIGTGSGYQTAILSALAARVYTMEFHKGLLEKAREALTDLGCTNVNYRVGNGRLGWPEEAPFDRVLCAAAADEVPAAWINQLGDPGILITPVGDLDGQWLVRVTKRGGRLTRQEFCPCRFVPLLGDGDAGQ
jgi:protein-L-isoaspartate(D-aspartate) O-methyltransferase